MTEQDKKKAPRGNGRNTTLKDRGGNNLVSFWRALKLGLANFWRNKFLSVATILVMAVIIFIFNVILAIQYIGNQALQSLSERVDIVIYLRDDISFYDAGRLRDELAKLPGVTTVKYTSKEEALQIVARTHPQTAEFLQKFNLRNPLPPSISIITRSPEDHAAIEQFLQQPEYKNMTASYVTEGGTGESIVLSTVAQNLGNISRFVRQIIFWMVLVFVLGGTLIVFNAIQLTIYTRRNEIHIMRLVGATPNFIRMPFIIEGALYGVLAVLLSFLILGLLASGIRLEDTNLWAYYSDLQFARIFTAEIAVTIALAVVSSFTAVQQYLKGQLTVN